LLTTGLAEKTGIEMMLRLRGQKFTTVERKLAVVDKLGSETLRTANVKKQTEEI
jgi:hypothetical protein